MSQLYTPFVTQSASRMADISRDNLAQDLAKNAYMGDPQALGQLYQINPQAAQQIERAQVQRQQVGLSQQAQAQKQQQAFFEQNKELVDEITGDVAAFDTFEDANAYVERRKSEYRPIVGGVIDQFTLTPDSFQQIKQIRGADIEQRDPVRKSTDIEGEGAILTRKSGKVEFKPISIEAKQAYIKSQEADIKQAATKEERVEAAKLMAKNRSELRRTVNEAAFKARENIPVLDDLEQLAKLSTTGTFGEKRLALKRSFGVDVSDEEAFMAQSNRIVLAAADALKGALSDRENNYLEAIGPAIGKSREGNLKIIKSLKVIAENSIDRQKALRSFKGDPVDFTYSGKPLGLTPGSIDESGSAEPTGVNDYTEGSIVVNPKTGERLRLEGGSWNPL